MFFSLTTALIHCKIVYPRMFVGATCIFDTRNIIICNVTVNGTIVIFKKWTITHAYICC